MKIMEVKRQWDTPSGSDGKIIFSLEVLSGQSCDPQDRTKTLPHTHGQNTEVIFLMHGLTDNAEIFPFTHPSWGNSLKMYQKKLDSKQRRTKKIWTSTIWIQPRRPRKGHPAGQVCSPSGVRQRRETGADGGNQASLLREGGSTEPLAILGARTHGISLTRW